MRLPKDQSGLTLIELLIALGISGFLLGAMVMAFSGQSKSYNSQQEITALQENLWAALQIMSRDILMAGYDPKASGNFGITQAGSGATGNAFIETADTNTGLGDTPGKVDFDEHIEYRLDKGTLQRVTGYNNNGALGWKPEPVINNITRLNFAYETVTPAADPSLPDTWAWQDSVTDTADLANIRIVKICIQGRTAHPTSIKDTGVYNPTDTSNGSNTNGLDTKTQYSWTPAAGRNYLYRTMCIEVAPRNFVDKGNQ